MAENDESAREIVQFLRKRDYRLVRQLGRGACGKTVLLHDDQIDERFVCKKYAPLDDAEREGLFKSFVREIKLLHQVNHPNVIRIFTYFLFPEKYAGYILMEHVDGCDVDDFIRQQPYAVDEIFRQSVSGFAHLERCGILHRDVRPGNLMVRSDGTVKIIDLGFGKLVGSLNDFDKSITLNWWCEPPDEFGQDKYDFGTEVYFVGKLFQRLLATSGSGGFRYGETLDRMCMPDPDARMRTFSEVEQSIQGRQFVDVGFTDADMKAYRAFADDLAALVTKIADSAKYISDASQVVTRLEEVYRNVMLEEYVPDPAVVTRCLIDGTYYYRRTRLLRVTILKEFLALLKNSGDEKRRIIIGNLHSRLNAVQRYADHTALLPPPDDDIPF